MLTPVKRKHTASFSDSRQTPFKIFNFLRIRYKYKLGAVICLRLEVSTGRPRWPESASQHLRECQYREGSKQSIVNQEVSN